MTPTVPVFSPASAYRTGLLDGEALFRRGVLPTPIGVQRLDRPVWAVQAKRVRMVYLWGFLAGWRQAAERQPELVA